MSVSPMKGILSYCTTKTATLVNQAIVDADYSSHTIELASSLNIDDTASGAGDPRWKVNASGATLKFNRSATGLDGDFLVNVGVVDVRSDITTTGTVEIHEFGQANVEGATFCLDDLAVDCDAVINFITSGEMGYDVFSTIPGGGSCDNPANMGDPKPCTKTYGLNVDFN